jgi:hypothetical protein
VLELVKQKQPLDQEKRGLLIDALKDQLPTLLLYRDIAALRAFDTRSALTLYLIVFQVRAETRRA